MPIEFDNVKVIDDFDKNNFSGTVGPKPYSGSKDLKESIWRQRVYTPLLLLGVFYFKSKQCSEVAAGGEIYLKRSYLIFVF